MIMDVTEFLNNHWQCALVDVASGEIGFPKIRCLITVV